MTTYEVWDNKDPKTKDQFPYEVVEITEDGSESLALFTVEKYAHEFITYTEALNKIKQKVGELKGSRNLTRIECSCGETWIRYGNHKFDAKERRAFIEKHKDHDLLSFQVTSKAW